jgi:SpoVK/Ycf46/Vps4 family AAA+-type ATPase
LLIQTLRKYLPGRTVFIYGTGRTPQFLNSGHKSIYTIKLPYPDVEAREELWNHFLKGTGMNISNEISAADLADCYELSLSAIRQVVDNACRKAQWRGQKEIRKSDLKEHLFAFGDMGLSTLATYIISPFNWDDLQIEPAQRKVLMVACERFRHRNRVGGRLKGTGRGAYGNGVSVLLCGPPGTGKTMAAQVISEELQLPLYRIDVSQIYSKYLGETQKNLGEVFDQAQKSNVILFFDEADALFTKRTEVSDSHDKYANAETAYLLQKIEAHNGMVLLATNLFQNFDTAFVRRLTYVVRFNKPDEEVRLSLWKSILPDWVKVSPDIDYEFFAENFDIPGSSIKAILYSAMYMAASEGRELSNRDIVFAMKYEDEKNGILNNPTKFGRYSAHLYE